MKNTGTTGMNGVDWEARVDFDRLRSERLAKLKAELEKSDVGALLAFDFSNIRYMTATHIGTWAMDKLIRFALLTRKTDPIVWDFGSAAKHHALYNPWLDVTSAEADAERAASSENVRASASRPALRRNRTTPSRQSGQKYTELSATRSRPSSRTPSTRHMPAMWKGVS